MLTRAEVALLLSVSVRSVDRLRKAGILPAIKVFSSVRFSEEDVRRAILGLQQVAAR
jgi:excisionase family DNA binding protein